MIIQPARLITPLLRAVGGLLALALLAASLSGCADAPAPADHAADSPPTVPTRVASAAAEEPLPADVPEPADAPASAEEPRPTAVPPARSPADWTVLVYLDGDNDLEDSAISDFNEMASVGSNDSLNIVVQFDRVESEEEWDNASNGDWTGSKRFLIAPNQQPEASTQLADLGELNMGDPATLSDFITWGIQSYPAQRYALIFWDHGAAWPGVASDDTSDGDMLTLPEIATALAEAQGNTGLEKFDLIGFDACLMNQIDVLQTVAPFGEVAIGSADLEPGEGWAWNAWLGDLAQAPSTDAATLAPSIIESFTAFYKQQQDPSVTLAAFDLSKIDQMTADFDTLAGALIAAMSDSYAAIGTARAHANEYASGDDDVSAIDLGHFADLLAAAEIDPQITGAAQALNQTITSARIVQGFGDDHPESSGISIYFPWKHTNYDADYTLGSPLTDMAQWNDFLHIFYETGGNYSPDSAVSVPELNSSIVSVDAPLTLSATISGSDTAYVYYFVGAIDSQNPDRVQVFSMEYVSPDAQTDDGIPPWNDGDKVALTWNATSWYISNGPDVVRAPLMPIDYGSDTYSVDGTYTVSKTGTQTPVSIEFTVAEGQGTLQHIWAFDTGNSDNPRPRELTPRAGDTFTPDIMAFDAQSEDDDLLTDAGDPIVFGDMPLIVFEDAAPSGDYVIGLMTEDVTGDTTEQDAEVTVDNDSAATLPSGPVAASALRRFR